MHPTHFLSLQSPSELHSGTPYQEALASDEGHFTRQAPFLRSPKAVDLCVSDHGILIEAGVQVEGNVIPRVQVNVEPGGRQLTWIFSAH